MIEWFFNPLFNFWALILFNIIQDKIFLYITAGVILTFVIYFVYQKKPITIVIYISVTLLILFFFLILSFWRGHDINEKIIKGRELVQKIHNFKENKGEYPKNLENEFPEYFKEEFVKDIGAVNYRFNEISNNFSLIIIHPSLRPDYLKYSKGTFFLTDD